MDKVSHWMGSLPLLVFSGSVSFAQGFFKNRSPLATGLYCRVAGSRIRISFSVDPKARSAFSKTPVSMIFCRYVVSNLGRESAGCYDSFNASYGPLWLETCTEFSFLIFIFVRLNYNLTCVLTFGEIILSIESWGGRLGNLKTSDTIILRWNMPLISNDITKRIAYFISDRDLNDASYGFYNI